jgi:hypothetical protein
MFLHLRNIPPRLAVGGYLLRTGPQGWNGSQERAEVALPRMLARAPFGQSGQRVDPAQPSKTSEVGVIRMHLGILFERVRG